MQNILTIVEFLSPDRGPVLVLPFSSFGIVGANPGHRSRLRGWSGEGGGADSAGIHLFPLLFIGKVLQIMIDYLTLLSIYYIDSDLNEKTC